MGARDGKRAGQYPRADQGDEGDIGSSQREVSWRQRHAIVWDEELGIGRKAYPE